MPDEIKVKILKDGTIKLETDAISGPNHLNAEELLAMVSRLTGGAADVQQRGHTHSHGQQVHQHH